MKKKILIGLVVLICLSAVGTGLYLLREKRIAEAEAAILALDYKHQNWMFPRTEGELREYRYMNYDAIDERELYVRLALYNQERAGEAELTLEDVKEYLSQEYNDDGSLRIHSGYENIRDYEYWYFQEYGCDKVEEYWIELEGLAMDYKGEHPQFEGRSVRMLSIEQLQELIKKEADPSYQIDDAVMEGK